MQKLFFQLLGYETIYAPGEKTFVIKIEKIRIQQMRGTHTKPSSLDSSSVWDVSK